MATIPIDDNPACYPCKECGSTHRYTCNRRLAGFQRCWRLGERTLIAAEVWERQEYRERIQQQNLFADYRHGGDDLEETAPDDYKAK